MRDFYPQRLHSVILSLVIRTPSPLEHGVEETAYLMLSGKEGGKGFSVPPTNLFLLMRPLLLTD